MSSSKGSGLSKSHFVNHVSLLNWETANAGQSVSISRENVQKSAFSKARFGGLRKWDWSGMCPIPQWQMTGRE